MDLCFIVEQHLPVRSAPPFACQAFSHLRRENETQVYLPKVCADHGEVYCGCVTDCKTYIVYAIHA